MSNYYEIYMNDELIASSENMTVTEKKYEFCVHCQFTLSSSLSGLHHFCLFVMRY